MEKKQEKENRERASQILKAIVLVCCAKQRDNDVALGVTMVESVNFLVAPPWASGRGFERGGRRGNSRGGGNGRELMPFVFLRISWVY